MGRASYGALAPQQGNYNAGYREHRTDGSRYANDYFFTAQEWNVLCNASLLGTLCCAGQQFLAESGLKRGCRGYRLQCLV